MEINEEVAAYNSGHISIPREKLAFLYETFPPLTCHLAIYLITKANWKPKPWFDRYHGQVINVERGQLVTSLANMAKGTQMSIQNVRTALSHLRKSNFINSEKSTRQPTQHFSLISIYEYDTYVTGIQEANTTPNTPSTRDQHVTNTPSTTTEERKNIRKKEYSSKDPTLFPEQYLPPKENTNGKIRVRCFTEDMKIDSYCLQFAAKNGLNGRAEILWLQMIDWHMKEGKGTQDLHASFRVFVRNEVARNKGRLLDQPLDCPECGGLTRFDKTTRERIKCKTCGKQ